MVPATTLLRSAGQGQSRCRASLAPDVRVSAVCRRTHAAWPGILFVCTDIRCLDGTEESASRRQLASRAVAEKGLGLIGLGKSLGCRVLLLRLFGMVWGSESSGFRLIVLWFLDSFQPEIPEPQPFTCSRSPKV